MSPYPENRGWSADFPARLAVAVLGIPVVLAAVWLGPVYLLPLAAASAGLGWWEYSALVDTVSSPGSRWLGLGLVVAAPIVTLLLGSMGLWFLSVLVFLGVASWHLRSFEKRGAGGAAAILFGFWYLGIPFALAMLVRMSDQGQWLLLYLLLFVWLSDTAAFMIGRLAGRTPLSPKISPGKTWEGAVGALLLSLIVATFLPAKGALSGVLLPGFAFVTWAATVTGDLFESSLKRGAGVKDSGRLLPGHGGLLDRIDGLVFAISVAYVYLRLVAWLSG